MENIRYSDIDTIHWNCLHGVNYKIKDDFSALQRLELHGSHRAFRFTILFIISLIHYNMTSLHFKSQSVHIQSCQPSNSHKLLTRNTRAQNL